MYCISLYHFKETNDYETNNNNYFNRICFVLAPSYIELPSFLPQKSESQNGFFKKTKHAKFPKNEHFLPPDTHTYVCVSRGRKCSFFGKLGVLCFLEILALRFVLLPYYRRTLSVNIYIKLGYFQITWEKGGERNEIKAILALHICHNPDVIIFIL